MSVRPRPIRLNAAAIMYTIISITISPYYLITLIFCSFLFWII
jgi:hypothetical protein